MRTHNLATTLPGDRGFHTTPRQPKRERHLATAGSLRNAKTSRSSGASALEEGAARPNTGATHLKTSLFWIACFLSPIAVYCVLLAWGGIYPFGPESFLTEDLKYQYIDFFTWYRRVLTGDANIFYSFAQGMGSNTWGLYSYYLASPFNLLILLFNEAHLTLAIVCIVALKLGCMQVSMTWYLRRRFELPRLWAGTLGLCFTWSTWVATNLRNPLWLDALILLPLAAWCCYQLIRQRSWVPLALLTALNVICCWYMAYITCLFLCLFVLFELAVYLFEGHTVSMRWVAGRAGRFTGAMALGMALAAWTFVPTVLAMAGGSSTQEIVPVVNYPKAIVLGLLPYQWTLNLVPQFYSGLAPLALALLFLACRRIDGRIRVLALVFAALLTVSSYYGILQFIWCGMRVPNGFYSRTAFLVGFMEIWAAGYFLTAVHGNKTKTRALHGAFAHASEGPDTVKASALSAGAKTYKATNNDARKPSMLGRILHSSAVSAIVLVVSLADLGLNAHLAMNQLYIGYTQEQNDAYTAEAHAWTDVLETQGNAAFYRVDKTFNRAGAAFNEGIAHGFNQLSTYSSANSPAAVAFLNALGYSSQGEFSSVYAAPNLVMDSLLGVTYVSTWGTPAGYETTTLPAVANGAATSYNPHALSLGYPLADIEQAATALDASNPFERQNALVAALTGDDTPLYTKLEARETARNADGVSWEVKVPAGHIGYTFVVRGENAGSYWPVKLTIDEVVTSPEGWRFANNVRELDHEPVSGTAASATHHVTVSCADGYADMPSGTDCAFYALDYERFEQLVDTLKTHEFTPSVFEDGYVSGTYQAGSNTNLVLSIPYDKGWSALVDGEPTTLQPVFNGGMSLLELTEGEHTIEMTYRSPGLFVGGAITCAAVAGLCVAYVARQRGRSQHRR